MKKICIISFIAIAVMVICTIIFTHLWGNLYCQITGNGYFIPTESSIFTFQPTKWNDGNGDWWLYGEDRHYYYGLNTEQDTTPNYFALHKGLEPEGFNRFDYTTWFFIPADIIEKETPTNTEHIDKKFK